MGGRSLNKKFIYLISIFLLVFTGGKESFKLLSSTETEYQDGYYYHNSSLPLTGEVISLGDSTDYGKFIEGEEVESYLLNSDRESYSYTGRKKKLPFLKRCFFSYLKTVEGIERTTIGEKNYLRQGKKWVRIREWNNTHYDESYNDYISYLKRLSSGEEDGEAVNPREREKINISLSKMDQRIDNIRKNIKS